MSPISYTELCERFDAANVEAANGKVLLDKRTMEPTPAEYAKRRAILERHGITGFKLRWERTTRRFEVERTR